MSTLLFSSKDFHSPYLVKPFSSVSRTQVWAGGASVSKKNPGNGGFCASVPRQFLPDCLTYINRAHQRSASFRVLLFGLQLPFAQTSLILEEAFLSCRIPPDTTYLQFWCVRGITQNAKLSHSYYIKLYFNYNVRQCYQSDVYVL